MTVFVHCSLFGGVAFEEAAFEEAGVSTAVSRNESTRTFLFVFFLSFWLCAGPSGQMCGLCTAHRSPEFWGPQILYKPIYLITHIEKIENT
jgi:hypothetical protein